MVNKKKNTEKDVSDCLLCPSNNIKPRQESELLRGGNEEEEMKRRRSSQSLQVSIQDVGRCVMLAPSAEERRCVF